MALVATGLAQRLEVPCVCFDYRCASSTVARTTAFSILWLSADVLNTLSVCNAFPGSFLDGFFVSFRDHSFSPLGRTRKCQAAEKLSDEKDDVGAMKNERLERAKEGEIASWALGGRPYAA